MLSCLSLWADVSGDILILHAAVKKQEDHSHLCSELSLGSLLLALEDAYISHSHTRTMAWSCAPTWRAASHLALFCMSAGGSACVLVAGSPNERIRPQWERSTSFQGS